MFALQQTPIDTLQLRQMRKEPIDGAFVCFEGLVRADSIQNSTVDTLFYHANESECAIQGQAIIQEALTKYKIHHAACVQRIGNLSVGECAIWIGVWAGHRDEAYLASRYIIEEIKKRLLIWKKELLANGTGQWVHGAQ